MIGIIMSRWKNENVTRLNGKLAIGNRNHDTTSIDFEFVDAFVRNCLGYLQYRLLRSDRLDHTGRLAHVNGIGIGQSQVDTRKLWGLIATAQHIGWSEQDNLTIGTL
mmetsp:Transcript_36205/g.104318  ORF Transcript_36205/g.104318 Transcript_36205/m.104318 type:complete len:107 (+) Transcript_36205:367-687(+)